MTRCPHGFMAPLCVVGCHGQRLAEVRPTRARGTPDPAATFRCWQCQTTKPVTEFHSSRYVVRGHEARCKACNNAARREKGKR